MQKKGVKTILFDMDGVLVDSFDTWSYVFNDTLNHFGFKKLSKEEFRKEFGSPIEHDVKKYFHEKSVREIEKVYNSKFKKRVNHVKLFPQSIDVLKKIKKQNTKIGLITNSTRIITLAVLNHFKLKRYFDVVVTMDDVKRRKPAPDMILKACKALKVKPKNIILVGDTKNDMIAGKKAGCATVGYKVKGTYKINRLGDVIMFLNKKWT